MSKKSKGVVLDSISRYGGGVYEDAKSRLRHQALIQDYEELQRETDAMRSKLETANQRKLILAAEVRFLRRRYKYLLKAKSTSSSQKYNGEQVPNLLKQAKTPKEQVFVRKQASLQMLPFVPDPKKKKQCIVQQVAMNNATAVTTDHQARKKVLYGVKQAAEHSSTPLSNLNPKGRKRIRKELVCPNTTLMLEKNHKRRMLCANDAALRNSMAAFDLNQDGGPSWKEASIPSRAPTFDLNEISTGDEDFQMNVEEAKKSLIRGINDEQQNDLKLAVCRNLGEGTSRVGKRKISWQDPVALRV